MQGATPERRENRRSRSRLGIQALDFGRHVEVALGAQEEAVTRTARSANEANRLVKG